MLTDHNTRATRINNLVKSASQTSFISESSSTTLPL